MGFPSTAWSGYLDMGGAESKGSACPGPRFRTLTVAPQELDWVSEGCWAAQPRFPTTNPVGSTR